MTSHILLPQLDPAAPATFSRAILGDLLRGELGFEGVIVSDALDMEGASGEHRHPGRRRSRDRRGLRPALHRHPQHRRAARARSRRRSTLRSPTERCPPIVWPTRWPASRPGRLGRRARAARLGTASVLRPRTRDRRLRHPGRADRRAGRDVSSCSRPSPTSRSAPPLGARRRRSRDRAGLRGRRAARVREGQLVLVGKDNHRRALDSRADRSTREPPARRPSSSTWDGRRPTGPTRMSPPSVHPGSRAKPS